MQLCEAFLFSSPEDMGRKTIQREPSKLTTSGGTIFWSTDGKLKGNTDLQKPYFVYENNLDR